MKAVSHSYPVKMRELPLHERPRERLMSHGPEALSNTELLSVILGSGTKNESVMNLSARILSSYGFERLSDAGHRQLKTVHGISDAKACTILASVELGKRIATGGHAGRRSVQGPEDVAMMVAPRMRGLRKEHFRGIYLDSKKHVIKDELISVGGLNSNSVHPREVFGPAIRESAAALILVHNHPSGDPTPSRDDVKTTGMISEAAEMLGIELLDHIVIGRDGYRSLREEGLF
jgi:DNA repair protein RadC